MLDWWAGGFGEQLTLCYQLSTREHRVNNGYLMNMVEYLEVQEADVFFKSLFTLKEDHPVHTKVKN